MVDKVLEKSGPIGGNSPIPRNLFSSLREPAIS